MGKENAVNFTQLNLIDGNKVKDIFRRKYDADDVNNFITESQYFSVNFEEALPQVLFRFFFKYYF
jgi:hypothetical protein